MDDKNDRTDSSIREKKRFKKKKIRAEKRYMTIRRSVFFASMFVIAFIGLLFSLRPEKSALEKRTLEKFPEFTVQSFFDGSYTSQISIWYADTFPFRERMLSANASLQNLYGLRDQQIVATGVQVGDEIPDEAVSLAGTDDIRDQDNGTGTGDGNTEQGAEPEAAEIYEDGTIYDMPEVVGDVFVSGDTAFDIFYFNVNGANDYVQMIDKAQRELDGKADIYSIIVPTSIGINLSEDIQRSLNSGNQRDAIDYIYSSIHNTNSKVTTVEVYDILKNHNSEYIYFRTDHHWTALGAYYAYEQFCGAKGLTPKPLSDYEQMEFEGFIGSFYSGSNQAASLKKNPDTVMAYVPEATNEMYFWDSEDNKYSWNIITDVSTWKTGTLYSTFIGGDEPYSEIENPGLDDGSSCVVVKDSYGNAFVPFLIDHYQYVYVVDYRYFSCHKKYGNSLARLVEDKEITDVIFVNNIVSSDSEKNVSLMKALFD